VCFTSWSGSWFARRCRADFPRQPGLVPPARVFYLIYWAQAISSRAADVVAAKLHAADITAILWCLSCPQPRSRLLVYAASPSTDTGWSHITCGLSRCPSIRAKLRHRSLALILQRHSKVVNAVCCAYARVHTQMPVAAKSVTLPAQSWSLPLLAPTTCMS